MIRGGNASVEGRRPICKQVTSSAQRQYQNPNPKKLTEIPFQPLGSDERTVTSDGKNSACFTHRSVINVDQMRALACDFSIGFSTVQTSISPDPGSKLDSPRR